MALVDYSDSESDVETELQPAPAPKPATQTTAAKKLVNKVVDRSNPRKILVNLSGTAQSEEASPVRNGDEPPTKRARRNGAFGGFASLLPPPKNTGKPAASSGSGKPAPRPGINLKTGATPGFSRSLDVDEEGEGSELQQPSIPAEQKPADEVRLVGKPLMFKPLSVSRKKPTQKKTTAPKPAVAPQPTPVTDSKATEAVQEEKPPKKKVSLFSLEEPTEDMAPTPSTGAYEPLFAIADGADTATAFAEYDAQFGSQYAQSATNTRISQSDSLDAIASDMNLSAEARRELFGRRGAPGPQQSATKVRNFNMDQEYAHNEELRAAGEQQVHNPVRAIAPGKHSLRQLVNQVQNQKEALEESFAKGKSNRNEAGARYGWR